MVKHYSLEEQIIVCLQMYQIQSNISIIGLTSISSLFTCSTPLQLLREISDPLVALWFTVFIS